MQNLSLYYSDSFLSGYLNESKDTLVAPSTQLLKLDLSVLSGSRLPQIAVESVEKAGELSSQFNVKPKHLPEQHSQYLTLDLLTLSTARSRPVRMSVVSLASTYNPLYSSVSENSEDLDLYSVRLQLDRMVIPEKETKLGKFKRLIKGKEKHVPELDDDGKFMAYVWHKLQSTYYFYEKTSTLNVPWREAAEVFFFGDRLDDLYGSKSHILNYIMLSPLELGKPRFSNLSRFHEDTEWDVVGILEQLVPNWARFNDILDLYAESEENKSRPELFELFSAFANQSDGLCIPLAIGMFGRWLLEYNRNPTVKSNYQDSLILNFFRKATRMALALEKVKDMLEAELTNFDSSTKLALTRYLNKDNRSALSIGLQSLGEYYQYEHNHNVSVTLWELNCHLTQDSESGNLAILGLTDGYGFGNLIKEHNHLGKRSKTNKFNTKRRIAHLYRILMNQSGFDEYGVSWATKEKYD